MHPKPASALTSLVVPLCVVLAFVGLHSQSAAIAALIGDPWQQQLGTALPLLLSSLIWISCAFLIGRGLFVLILTPMIRSRTGMDAPSILANFIHAALLIITIPMIIKFVFGRPIGGLVASSGLVTLIIGFAIRDMIADFFSGLAMNIERPYSIGDWLELGPDLVGKVSELNWRSTRLLTLSGKTVVVPNNNLAGRQFINYSLPQRHYRERLRITLNYTTDPERAENILKAALMATPGLATGADHNVRICEFTERGVVYEIRFWIDDLSAKVGVRHRLAGHVLRYLHQAGIPIPYSQQEIVLSRHRRPRQERRIDAARLLSRMELLETLTDDEIEQLANVAIARNYAAGTVIFERGEEGHSLYLLVEGVAEARVGDNGKAARSAQIEPGHAFGEMSLLTGAPRAATVHAVTQVHALEIRRVDLQPIFQARPEITNELATIMARRVDANRQSMANGGGDDDDDAHTSRVRHIAGKITHFFGLGPTH